MSKIFCLSFGECELNSEGRTIWMKKFALVMLVLVMAFAVTACGSKDDAADPIKIGVQGPISGQWALEGTGFVRAVTMLAEEINADGGINGREIQIIQGDDKGDPKEATLVAQRLVNQGVVAVVGAYNSTATEPASAIYNEAGVLHVTPSSTATGLTEKGYDQFFRTCFLDDRQGLFAAEFMTGTLGAKKIALIHDNTTYAKGLADWTKIYLEELGAEVVFFDAIVPGEREFGPTLTRLKNVNPDAIYFTGYFSEGGLLLKQARDMGITSTFVAGNANNNADFIEIAGIQNAKGAIITTEPIPTDIDYPEARKFIDDYQARYGEMPPSIWTLSAADAFRVVVEAIEKTQSTDKDKLANYLHNTMKDFPGITGPITFDEKGDRLGTVHRAYIVNEKGEFVPYSN